ncbi:MAG: ATP-binding cassette domain-containing protein [Candidatus Hydrothermarchaeales archaeon]
MRDKDRDRDKLLEIRDVKKYYPVTTGLLSKHAGDITAVEGVSLYVREGETLGLVGESGCGKTTLGKVILRLEEPTSGQVLFRGEDIRSFQGATLRQYRKEVQMVFQDPQASLDPRMTVGECIGEALLIHGVRDDEERLEKVKELLEKVGLEAEYASRYPHEFSGGQKQRIGIARALALSPKLLVADEPVSALDVSIQAQILNLFADMQKEYGLAYLFIAHNLGVIRHISDRVAIMRNGRIIETAPTQEIFENPKHPYTKTLLSAIPVPNPHVRRA